MWVNGVGRAVKEECDTIIADRQSGKGLSAREDICEYVVVCCSCPQQESRFHLLTCRCPDIRAWDLGLRGASEGFNPTKYQLFQANPPMPSATGRVLYLPTVKSPSLDALRL